MVYLKYLKANGTVVSISETPFSDLTVDYKETTHKDFKVGDEFDNYISVQEDSDGNVISFTLVTSSPLSKHILVENQRLNTENAQLKSELASTQEAVDFLLMGGI